MPLELRLSFPAPDRAAVQLLDDSLEESSVFHFANPLTDKDLEEIRWYLEDYGSRYAAEPDDERAATVRRELRAWGAALFNAVFKADDTAMELYRRFRDEEEPGRLLTIAASHPAVLSLPWELLRPADGVFLFAENPRIAIRRGLPAAGQGRKPHKRDTKAALRLLFIVSRPEEGASFINPRTDPQAVLNALDLQEQQRVEVEFLRPATLAALENLLRAADQPAVDIIHFDGHGAFDRHNSLRDKAAVLPSYMQGLLREAEERGGDAPAGGQGYLLFEDETGGPAFADARSLGELLFRQKVGLVVLSACQSAAMGEDDAMSGVAARLVHAGIPAVLAMTHSVLVKTTETLFAEFYRSLFKGGATGTALDDARAALRRNPNRGIRLRGADGAQEVPLELEDWFLPALYQNGADKPLLKNQSKAVKLPPKAEPPHNLPAVQESGFFGRSKELWQIERAFAVKGCRRFSITGFGGQGKTALALEAGRWLLRTKLFQRACLVSFASYQGSDPVAVTLATMRAVFAENLPDDAAVKASLDSMPTLLILDNLESLADGGKLAELLDAAAQWSAAKGCRVLLTSRQPDFRHPSYPLAGSYAHQTLALQGLQPHDAVAWFDELRRLPPKATLKRPRRDVLIRLFEQVGFHPLSISLLAQQLKERGPADVGERLEALLALQPLNREDRSLLASLALSIERLPERCRKWLPRLGVFQGGGLEEIVVQVAGMEEYPSEWSILRYHLMLSGLMHAEQLPKDIFLRFHPTLAPALWEKLSEEEQATLTAGYCNAYYQLSKKLYLLDQKTPHAARAVAQCELSNMLRAVHAALQVSRVEESVEFAVSVNWFLDILALRREYKALAEAAAQIGGVIGSQAWYQARFALGEQLCQNGQTAAAEQIFQGILAELGEAMSYERCLTLGMLCRCCKIQGQSEAAERLCRQELTELAWLDQNEAVRLQTASAQTVLADALRDQGRYREAKEAYQIGLEIKEELGDKRGVAVSKGLLGTLARMQGELSVAAERLQEAVILWRSLNEPVSEAVDLHQLSIVYQEDRQWKKAEEVCREVARIQEERGDIAGIIGAGNSWNELALICTNSGRLAEAEQWFRKALKAYQNAKEWHFCAMTLSNLAVLLTRYPARLNEARYLAEESLAIKETLDPAAAEIWKTYDILADIADKQGDSSQAASYRASSKQAYAIFPGAQQQVQQYGRLIAAVVQAVIYPDLQSQLQPSLEEGIRLGWGNQVTAIRRILSGERDEAALCEPLNFMDAAIIRAILEGIAENA